MEFLFVINQSIIPLFIILAVAIFYEIRFRPDITGMNNIALQILNPVLIFKKVTDSGYGLSGIAPYFMYMLLFTLAMALIGTVCAKIFRMQKNTSAPFVSNSALMNFGNLGIPLVIFAFGNSIYTDAILFWIVFNIPLTTYGIWLCDDDKSLRKAAINLIKIPIFPAFILAVIFNEAALTVPQMLAKPMDFFSDATIPVNTIIFGLKLAHVKYKPGMGRILTGGVIIRLLISPFIALLLVKLLNFPTLMAQAAVVMASTPMASSQVMYSIALKKDYSLTAALILVTTIVSAFTLPLVITVVKNIF